MKTMKLGDACETINGLWTGKKGPFETAKVIRNTNFTKDCRLDLSNVAILEVEARQLSTRRLRKGDLVIEKSGGGPKQPVGRVVLFEEEGDNFSLSNFTSALRIKSSSSYVPKYLYYFILLQYVSGVTEKMQSNTTGIRNLNFKQYLDMDVPTPSLPEQKTIVEKLDAAFAEIDKLEENLESMEMLSKNLLNSANRKFFDDPHDRVMPLSEIADFEGGQQPPKSEFVFEKTSGYVRFVQIRDFKSDRNVTYIPNSSRNRMCKEFDVLIGRYGASVGQILTGLAGAYNVALMKVLPNEKIVSRSYLFHYLQSESFQSLLANVAQRSAQAGFSKDDIANFPVPVPDLQEQDSIVNHLEVIGISIENLR